MYTLSADTEGTDDPVDVKVRQGLDMLRDFWWFAISFACFLVLFGMVFLVFSQ